MKHWTLAALLSLAVTSAGTGCIIIDDTGEDPVGPFGDRDSDRDGVPDSADNCPNQANADQRDTDGDGIGEVCDFGYLDVTWNLVKGDRNDPADCPVGSTIQVVQEDSVGTQYTDLFMCEVGTTLTADLPDDTYVVWVNLQDPEETLLAQSAPQTVEVVSGAQAPIRLDYTFSIDRGSIGVSWVINVDGIESSCTDAGVGRVRVLSTLIGPNTSFDDPFACQDGVDGQVVVPALPLGDYSVVVRLLEGSDPLDESLPVETSLEHGNDFRELEPFVFNLVP